MSLYDPPNYEQVAISREAVKSADCEWLEDCESPVRAKQSVG